MSIKLAYMLDNVEYQFGELKIVYSKEQYELLANQQEVSKTE